MKSSSPKWASTNGNVGKARTQKEFYPEDKIRARPLISPAYHRARSRGFMQSLDPEDWLDTDAEIKRQKRIAP